MPSKTLLLSLRPEFAKKVFAGTKRVELRRIWPKAAIDDWVLVYVSTPVKALVGAFQVSLIMEANLSYLWEKVRHHAGVTRQQFDDYYAGALKGYGIFLRDTRTLPNPIELSLLRELWSDFHPPQCYRYLDSSEIEQLEFFSKTISTRSVFNCVYDKASERI